MKPSCPKRILLVEDEVMFADALSDILVGEGMNVTVANDEKNAVQCLQTGAFDLILLDLMLPPDLDQEPTDWGYRTGIRILKKLREMGRKTPVVVVSVVRDKAVLALAEEHGVAGYIQKPASAEAIIRTINRLVGRRRPCDRLE